MVHDVAEIMSIGAKAKMAVLMHYVRESAFRYTDADSLYTKIQEKKLSGKPEVKVQVNVVGRSLGGNVFESIMEIRVKTVVDASDVYTADFNFATVLSIEEADSYDNDVKQFVTTVRAAYLAFPFVRSVLFDMTRESGSTPIALDPIDFEAMYLRARADAAEQGVAVETPGGLRN